MRWKRILNTGQWCFILIQTLCHSCSNTIFFHAVLVGNKKRDKGTSRIYARTRVRKDNTTVSEKTEKTRVSIQSCLLHEPAVRLERDVAEKELPLKVGIRRRWAQVKYSTHSTAQRYVYVLSHLFSLLSIPGFSNGQFFFSVLGTNFDRVRDNFKRVSDARWTFYSYHRVNGQRETLNSNLRLTW